MLLRVTCSASVQSSPGARRRASSGSRGSNRSAVTGCGPLHDRVQISVPPGGERKRCASRSVSSTPSSYAKLPSTSVTTTSTVGGYGTSSERAGTKFKCSMPLRAATTSASASAVPGSVEPHLASAELAREEREHPGSRADVRDGAAARLKHARERGTKRGSCRRRSCQHCGDGTRSTFTESGAAEWSVASRHRSVVTASIRAAEPGLHSSASTDHVALGGRMKHVISAAALAAGLAAGMPAHAQGGACGALASLSLPDTKLEAFEVTPVPFTPPNAVGAGGLPSPQPVSVPASAGSRAGSPPQ